MTRTTYPYLDQRTGAAAFRNRNILYAGWYSNSSSSNARSSLFTRRCIGTDQIHSKLTFAASIYVSCLLTRPHVSPCSSTFTRIHLLALVDIDTGSHRFSFTVGQHEARQLGEHTKTGMWTNILLACFLAVPCTSPERWTQPFCAQFIGLQSIQRRTTDKNDTRKNRHAAIEWDGMGCTARGEPPPSSL